MANEIEKILLIVTCYNRKQLTRKFLKSVYSTLEESNFNLDVLLVDDASPDKTGIMVATEFPKVTVIYGDGTLYWGGGVRLALQHLNGKLQEYDRLLLANDDVEFVKGALDELVRVSREYNAFVGGTVLTSDGKVESTGGKFGILCKPKPRLITANGEIQRCDMLPGHVLLIPINRLEELGGFDNDLPYRFLDLEITIRATRQGIPVLLAPNPVAITNDFHNYFEETSSMRGSLKELVGKILLDPKGPYWRESVHYLKKVSPVLWWLWLPFFYRAFLKAVLLSYFEKMTDRVKKG